MTTVKRAAGIVAAVTGLVVGLAACGSGPSQVNSAVIIDDKSISVNDVQNLVDKIVREQPAAKPLAQQHKLDLVAREALSQLIIHDLVTKAARDEHITASRDDVAAAVATDPFAKPVPTDGSVPPEALPAQLVYRARNLRDTVTDQILLAQLADKYLKNLVVTMDYTTVMDSAAATDPNAKGDPVAMRAKAEAKAKQFAANPDKVAGIIAQDKKNGGSGEEGAPFPADQVVAQDPTLAASVLFGAPEGSVVAFQPQAGQAFWVVGVIRSRDTNGKGTATQPPQVTADQVVAIGRRMLQPLADRTDIRVSPRYGIWDPSAMGVSASEAETVGIVLPPHGAAKQ